MPKMMMLPLLMMIMIMMMKIDGRDKERRMGRRVSTFGLNL